MARKVIIYGLCIIFGSCVHKLSDNKMNNIAVFIEQIKRGKFDSANAMIRLVEGFIKNIGKIRDNLIIEVKGVNREDSK